MRGLKTAAIMASGLVAALAAGAVSAGDADGVWRTEASDDGGYLEVTMAPCDTDATKTCGTITAAYTEDGPDPDYVNLGKLIVEDMAPDGETSFSGGTIWDPEHDKVYRSKMTVHGNELDVEGCVSIICSGEHWAKVN